MAEKSRTEYSARNTTVAMLCRVLAILMGFATRVVFTHTLSESYVGINGLFTDILNVLSLSELGIGTAITFALYRPIAEENIQKQKAIMKLFARLYQFVALLVLAIGLAIVPFLGKLVGDPGDVDSVLLIYLLYLTNSVLSYLLIYKKTLVDAHQLSYIGVLYHTIFLVIQDAFQILVLLLTGNFILFLMIYMLCTLGYNISIARKANSLYPFLKEASSESLPKEERREIVRNIRAMLMHKIGNVAVNNTDNILISAMVGIVSTGIYSNYFLVIGSVRQVLDQLFGGITASVGNLGVSEGRGRVKKIFEAAFFVGQWMYGFAAICLFELLTPFVELSFGKQYVFAPEITFVLCINFFVSGMRQATLVFRDSLGLFWYDRYKSIAEAVINLGLSILLTMKLGIIGVFLGTCISTLFTSSWIEPFVLYRKRLQESVIPYFLNYLRYCIVVLFAGFFTHTLCSFATGNPIKVLLLRLPFCLLIPNIMMWFCYHRADDYLFVYEKGLQLFRKSLNILPKLEKEDYFFLQIVKEALSEATKGHSPLFTEPQTKGLQPAKSDANQICDCNGLIRRCRNHSIIPIVYDVLKVQNITQEQKNGIRQSAQQSVRQNYHLLFETKNACSCLEAHNIEVAVLKGSATASYYPVPEYRKSGDIDLLLLDVSMLEQAKEVLSELGYTVNEEQRARHHVTFSNPSGIELELHTMLAEPFDNARMNRFMESLLAVIPEHVIDKEVLGVNLPMLSDGFHAYELLLHMLQHFLRSGFGMKLLCDWTFFWNRKVEEQEFYIYTSLIKESGLQGFSDMITSLCVLYLGLPKTCVLCEHSTLVEENIAEGFMQDILSAEEFGKAEKSRMVAMRGDSATDYMREFQHQMHLNFPKAGKCIIIWPVLWMVTLHRFLRNNRKIRGISTISIMKKAGDRSRRMRTLHLFGK